MILQNYPNISQLSAKINPYFDCVPTSIADGIEYLTGKRVDIDVMVTACYGPNYHGATSAARYVEYCAGWGVHLYPIDGAPATLVQDLHGLIQEGKPCLLTEPDVYAPAHPDWSHVLSVYGETPGVLIARDPYSTHDVTHPDSVWIQLLEYREIWVMEALMPALTIQMPAVAALFEEKSATEWISKATRRSLHDAHLADYKARGQVSLDYLGDLISSEQYLANGDSVLFFQGGARRWVKATGKVEAFDMFSAEGQAILRRALAVPAPVPEAPQEHAVIEQIKALVQAIP